MHEYVRGCAGIGSTGASIPPRVRFAPTPCVPTPIAPTHVATKTTFRDGAVVRRISPVEHEEIAFEVVQGQTTSARKQEQMSCSHAEDPVVKELGEA